MSVPKELIELNNIFDLDVLKKQLRQYPGFTKLAAIQVIDTVQKVIANGTLDNSEV